MRRLAAALRAAYHVWTGKAVIVNATITNTGIVRTNGIHWHNSKWWVDAD